MWVLSAATAPAPRPAAAAGQSSALSGWSLLLAASGAFLLEAWEPTPQLDDAFIPFRYARNLAEGYGLVYNPGEFVEGFTNLLWTLLVAAAPWLLWSSPDFARWSVSGILFAACVAAAFASQATGSCVGPPSSWRSPPSRGRRISSGTTWDETLRAFRRRTRLP